MKNRSFLYLPEYPSEEVSLEGFRERVFSIKMLFRNHSTILVQAVDLVDFYAALIAGKELEISLYLCPNSFDLQKMRFLAQEWNADLYLGDLKIESFSKQVEKQLPYVGIFTSGTTGEPKMALIRWDAIEYSAKYVPPRLRESVWMLSYLPWSYAGLQIFFSAWCTGGSIYHRTKPLKTICEEIAAYHVSVISATPTFWRLLISAWPPHLPRVRLQQATLGGEIVDQATIDLIENFFHPEHLTHIYASTEAGTAIIVSDRKAGFPVSDLQKESPSGLRFRIIAGELEICSPRKMDGYKLEASPIVDEVWVRTGDLVHIIKDRVYFLGRKDGRINVGGRKVCPEEIESALNSLDEIQDSLVYEKQSPIVGSLIIADVVIKSSEPFHPAEIKKKLQCILEDYKIPQMIRRVDSFGISNTGKKNRR